MDYADVRILYLAHGRAGVECLRKLLFELEVGPSNISVLTYDREENHPLMALCRQEGVQVSTGSIRAEETRQALLEFRADVVVSMHFRELIPVAIFQSAKMGGFNLHPSLLPRFRGCFSGVWAIIEGETRTGVTYHYLNDRFDDGKIVLQSELAIANDETGYTLFNRLIDLGVACFNDAFRLVVQDRFEGREQAGEASYYDRKLPYGGAIQPEWEDARIERFVRALNFPGLEGAHVETARGRVPVNTMDEYRQLMVRR